MIKAFVDTPHIYLAFLMCFSIKDIILFLAYSKFYLKLWF